jgi:hypothetical protein
MAFEEMNKLYKQNAKHVTDLHFRKLFLVAMGQVIHLFFDFEEV